MDENRIIETLTKAGGKLWEKANYRRIYFDPTLVMGMKINYYNTGNISGASVSCKEWDTPTGISNCEARRALDCKFWYDLTDGKFYSKNAGQLHGDATTAYQSFLSDLRAALSEQ